MPVNDRNTFKTGNGKRDIDKDFETSLTQVEASAINTVSGNTIQSNMGGMFLATANESGNPTDRVLVLVGSTTPISTINVTNMSIAKNDKVVVATLDSGENIIIGRYEEIGGTTGAVVLIFDDSDSRRSFVTYDQYNMLNKNNAYIYSSLSNPGVFSEPGIKYINSTKIPEVLSPYIAAGPCYALFDTYVIGYWSGKARRVDPSTGCSTFITGADIAAPFYVHENRLYFVGYASGGHDVFYVNLGTLSATFPTMTPVTTTTSSPGLDGVTFAHGHMWKLYREVRSPDDTHPDPYPVYNFYHRPIDILTDWGSPVTYEGIVHTPGTIGLSGVINGYTSPAYSTYSENMAVQPDGSLWFIAKTLSDYYIFVKSTIDGTLTSYDSILEDGGFSGVQLRTIVSVKNNEIYVAGSYIVGGVNVPAVWKISFSTPSIEVDLIWNGTSYAGASATAQGLKIREGGGALVWWAGSETSGSNNAIFVLIV